MVGTKILIVENDRIVAEDIKSSLKQLGFAVSGIVLSGEDAIRKVKEDTPDLVLMEILLKDEMNGIEAADQIQSQFNIPVVYLTAYADEEVVEKAKVTEPFGYLFKPFKDRELNTVIEIALYKHKMEKKLRDREQWLATTLKSIGDAVIATDKESFVTFMNPVAEALTGWDLKEATGKPLGDVFIIIHEKTRNVVENPVTKVLREGKIVGLANHTLLVSKDGKEIPIDDSGSPIRDEQGNITGVVLIFRDVMEKRTAEELLRESEEKYRNLINVSPDPIAIVQDHRHVFVNQRFTELFGYTMQDVENGLSSSQLLIEKDREKIVRRMSDIIEGKEVDPKYSVLNLVTKDGKKIPCECSGTQIVYNGRPADMATIRDITERKQAEGQLKLIKTAMDQSAEGIALADLGGNLTYLNNAFATMHGYNPEDLVGKHVSVFHTSEQMPPVEASLQQLMNHGEFNGELWRVKKDGTLFPSLMYNSLVYDEAGQPIIMIGTLRDISESKHVEEVLRENEAKFRTLFEDAGDALFIVEIEPGNSARFIECNQRTLSLFGCELSDIIGKSPALLSPEMQPDGKSSLEKTAEITKLVMEGKSQYIEWVHQRFDDKKQFFVEINLTRLTLGGKSNYMQAVVRDINDRKLAEEEKERLEAQLRQAQKIESLGTLAGGIAHEFNNILGIIIGNTELAISDVSEDDNAYNNLEEIQIASLRARDVVRQLLAFSRKTVEALKPMNLAPIVTEALKLIRSSIPTNIKIRKDILAEPFTVNADPTQVNQIIINLCTNASHAMQEEGGTLEVSLDNIELGENDLVNYHNLSAGNYMRLSVVDTGCGMTPKIMENIFDPFFTTKEVGQGTGMGLSVVHGIIKDHGGDITVLSESGKGTTFHILFPVVDWILEPDIKPSGLTPHGTEQILFVDDEKSIVLAAKHNLEDLGYTVVTETDPVHALEHFKENPRKFDLLITDTTMPGMTGDNLTKEVLKIRADLPVILCTGYSERISEKMAQKVGIKAFVMKPVVTHEMAKTIRKVLGTVKEEMAPYTSKRILVVDDEDQMRSMIREMLESSGFKVSEAPDGKVALWINKEKPADLVITDIIMPEKEGLETIMELKRYYPNVKIIAISGADDEKRKVYLDMAKKMGADNALSKPFEKEELLTAVKDLLG